MIMITDIESLLNIWLENDRKLTTDSRPAKIDGIFWALKGEHFDGNKFAAEALAKGASFVVVDNPDYFIPSDSRYLQVEDSLQSLQQLAKLWRQKTGVKIIAVVGSNGKTTTKELLRCVLSAHNNTWASPGNLNNHIGVPLSILGISPTHQFAIIEMGANHLKEITTLCEIAEPDAGVITSIGMDHLEGYGSIENIALSHYELIDWLTSTNKVFCCNPEMEYVKELIRKNSNNIYNSISETFNLRFVSKDLTGSSLNWKLFSTSEEYNFHFSLSGSYNLENLKLAIIIGLYFNIPAEKMQTAISKFQPGFNRSQWYSFSNQKVLLDAYNANPTSMKLAIQQILEHEYLGAGFILGDMYELGEYSEEAHKSLLANIPVNTNIKLICCGEEMEKAFNFCGITDKKWYPSYIELLQDSDEIKKWFSGCDVFLIKGSRGMQLEKTLAIWE